MELGVTGTGPLAVAHRHLARALGWLGVAAVTVAVSVLVWGLVADRQYDEERLRQRLLLETQGRSRYLAHHLRLLADELQRLGLRSEVDLFDHNMEPEASLLNLSQADSTFFNLGVGLIDKDGDVLWAEPRSFLAPKTSFAHSAWFTGMRAQRRMVIVAVDPDEHDAILYLVSPILRQGDFTGALIGGIDLTRESALPGHDAESSLQTVIASADGSVIFPPVPPAFASQREWKTLFASSLSSLSDPTAEVMLDGRPYIVALAPVGMGGLVLAKIARRDELLQPAWLRLRERLWLVLAAAVAPLMGLVYLFRRTLLGFQRSEQAAVREERLRRLGEASNLIAHEVRNSLNGLRVGLDLVLDGRRGPKDRVVTELRAELEHLSGFTHQLMLFAKDPKPRVLPSDLSEIVKTALSLTTDVAAELGIEIEVRGTEQPVSAAVDPVLIRIVISNLISNSLDALSSMQGGAEQPRVKVRLLSELGLLGVRVEDNGPGVTAELAQTLFEPFVTSKPSGVGIGLALARKIARAHGGELRLEPSLVGASFVLELKGQAA